MTSPPRIRATAHAALARRAIEESIAVMDAADHIDPTAYSDALYSIDQYADELMAPYDVATVLDTIEATRTTEGAVPWSLTGYEGALKALVDVREHAREDEEVPGA